FEKKFSYLEQQMFINSESIKDSNKAFDNIEYRFKKLENILNSLPSPERKTYATTTKEQLLAKLANIIVQIISIVVLVVSSFVEAVTNLHENVKVALLFLLMIYLLLKSFLPIFINIKQLFWH
ncbi:MAG: hypothetical protein MHPSP_003730, partial [Paramarteilia canceri]